MRDRVKLMAVKKKLPSEVLDYFKKQGAKGGKIGGKRRLTAISPERRTEIARRGRGGAMGEGEAEGGVMAVYKPEVLSYGSVRASIVQASHENRLVHDGQSLHPVIENTTT